MYCIQTYLSVYTLYIIVCACAVIAHMFEVRVYTCTLIHCYIGRDGSLTLPAKKPSFDSMVTNTFWPSNPARNSIEYRDWVLLLLLVLMLRVCE